MSRVTKVFGLVVLLALVSSILADVVPSAESTIFTLRALALLGFMMLVTVMFSEAD